MRTEIYLAPLEGEGSEVVEGLLRYSAESCLLKIREDPPKGSGLLGSSDELLVRHNIHQAIGNHDHFADRLSID